MKMKLFVTMQIAAATYYGPCGLRSGLYHAGH